jgi:hypothetical protein
MTQLSPTQREILSTAAAHDDGTTGAAEHPKAAATGLIKRGFMISVPASGGESRLLITRAGRAAIGAETVQTGDEREDVPALAAVQPDIVRPEAIQLGAIQPQGKIGQLVALLRRDYGASIDDMTRATGWQAHSVRGAISGAIKRGLGLSVASEVTDGIRRYRIAPQVGA